MNVTGCWLATLLALAVGPVAAEAPKPAVFVTLGTAGGPRVRVKRSEPANAVVINGATYLFDVGDGVQRQLAAAHLALADVRAIFISHHHVDHNAGLGPLIITRWLMSPKGALPIFGPPGTRAMADGLIAANQGTLIAPVTVGGPPPPPIATTIRATDLDPRIDDPLLVYRDENIRVTTIGVDHFHLPPGTPAARIPRAYAYRIEAGGRVFVFTGDTGPSANLVKLARGADVLVSEVVDLKAIEADLRRRSTVSARELGPMMEHMRQDHLTPDAIGRLASAAGVKEVVLTHFVPGLDSETDQTGYTTGIATTFSGQVILARDLDRF